MGLIKFNVELLGLKVERVHVADQRKRQQTYTSFFSKHDGLRHNVTNPFGAIEIMYLQPRVVFFHGQQRK